MPTFSLILPVYNRTALMGGVFQSIARASVLPDEIIVIDDGSTDGDVYEIIKQSLLPIPVIFHRIERAGAYLNSSRPYNVGIQLSSGDVSILCAAELLHFPKNFQFIREEMEWENVFLVGGNVFFEPEYVKLPDEVIQAPEKIMELDYDTYYEGYGGNGSRILLLNSVSGIHAIWRKHLVEMRGYEESLTAWGHNDGEIRRRATKLLGLQEVNCPDIYTIHRWHPRPDRENMNRAETDRSAADQVPLVANQGQRWGLWE